MSKFLIEEANIGFGKGFNCGPAVGTVVAELKIRDEEGVEFYLSNANVDGSLCNVFLTDKPTMVKQLDDVEDNEFIEYLHSHLICDGELEDMTEEVEGDPLYPAIKYAVYLTVAPLEEVAVFLADTKGKWTDEFTVPDPIDGEED